MSRFLNTQAASNMLGLHHNALSKMRCEGKGPRYLKLGRRVVYELKDIEAWLEKQKVDPA